MTTLECIDPNFEYVTDFTLKGERLGLRSSDWQDESGWLYAFATRAGIRYVDKPAAYCVVALAIIAITQPRNRAGYVP
jgi:hypothetical protein